MKKILQNAAIDCQTVRLIYSGSNTILPTYQAIRKAQEVGLDLVMINASDPPVCHILDGSKYKYEQAIKNKAAAKKQRAAIVKIKEVQFKLNISKHDLKTKCNNISRFLNKGNIVKLQVQFRGRERSNSAPGFDLINDVVRSVDSAEIDGTPQFSGNRITAIIKRI